MTIEITKPTNDELESRKVRSWPIWEKENSQFPWHYDQIEECFLLEGQVEVTTEDGTTVSFGKGDFVVFPKGMDCTWNITSPVKKHYNFK